MTFRMMVLGAASVFALAACGGAESEDADAVAADAAHAAADHAPTDEHMDDEQIVPALEGVIANADIRGETMARDAFRNPLETLEFFGLSSDMTVVEIWPGGGWYTQILAPYAAHTNGTYIAAGYDAEASEYAARGVARFAERYVSNPDQFGDIVVTSMGTGEEASAIAPAGTADLVLTFRNVHNWHMNEFADRAFADFYTALKPGGVLGVVEHRLPESADDEMQNTSGYMKQSVVVAMAEAAGFVLVEASEINANPADTADHPFGVWTLQPSSRTQDREGNTPDGFDAEAYAAIGESDRMTLKFIKPEMASE